MKIGMAEIQAWLLNHAEKVVLGGVGFLVLVFLYLGYSQEGLTSDPQSLQSVANNSRDHINRSTWKEAAPLRLPVPDNLSDPRSLATSSIDPALFPIPSPLDPVRKPPQNKRSDPKTYSPIELEAHAGSGPVAYIRQVDGGPQAAPKRLTAKERRKLLLEKRGFKFDKDGKPVLPEGIKDVPTLIRLGSTPIPGHRPTATVEPRGLRFVAVTALVPNRKQIEEYESALKEAVGYDPTRDTPRYIWYVVQRAETAKAEDPVNWDAPSVKRFTSKSLQGATINWDNVLDDPVPDKYFDPLLTSNGIPVMLRESERFLMHSKVERQKLVEDVVVPKESEKPREGNVPEGPDPLGPGPGIGPGVGPGVGPRGPGIGPIGPGIERGGLRPPPGRGMEGIGPGMGAMPNEPPPEYLLLRFYDTAVEPGKFYRYRVQLWLEDVNDPYRGAVVNVGGNPAAARTVSISWLDTAAAQRLKDKQAKDAKETPAGAMTPKHTYWRETEWSAPSPPVSLDREFNMYAGVVRSVKDVDRQRHGEPSGQVMAAQFDIVRAGDVACEYAIGRSAQVNFQDDAQMLNPVTLEVMPQKDYTFLTRHVVMDVRGGDPLPAWGKQAGVAADKSPVIPGEMLMLDERGQLVVKSEVDDFTDFDYYLYKPEAIAKPKPLNVPGGVNPGPGPIGPVGPGVERGGGVPFDFNAPGPRPGRGS